MANQEKKERKVKTAQDYLEDLKKAQKKVQEYRKKAKEQQIKEIMEVIDDWRNSFEPAIELNDVPDKLRELLKKEEA